MAAKHLWAHDTHLFLRENQKKVLVVVGNTVVSDQIMIAVELYLRNSLCTWATSTYYTSIWAVSTLPELCLPSQLVSDRQGECSACAVCSGEIPLCA